MLTDYIETVVLFQWHLFEANWAHVVIIAVVNECSIRILYAIFESFPSCLWCVLTGQIFWTLGLVEDARLASNIKMLAESIEPFKDGAVPWEWSKTDLIERLFETKDCQSLFLSQKGPPVTLCLLCFTPHVAEQEVPACSQRCYPTWLLVLGPAYAVPPVDVEVLALDCHFLLGDELILLHS